MSETFRKVKCSICAWRGYENDVLTGTNPFEVDDSIIGCPECKAINTIYVACDEEGCWKDATCGTPTDRGYLRTCSEHRPKEDT